MDAIRKWPYDLILMDVNMPEMDGLKATAAIRALPGARGQVPIIALTANAIKGDRERFLAAGMNGYISKPVDRRKLLAAIAKWSDGGTATGDEEDARSEAGAILDPAMIEDWKSFLPADKFAELVSGHVSESRTSIEELRAAAEARAFDEMRKLAHDLKSSCGTLGMRRVEGVAATLEAACIDGRESVALELIPALDAALLAAVAALESRYAEAGAD